MPNYSKPWTREEKIMSGPEQSPWTSMTAKDWDQLIDLNEGRPIEDPEAQQNLINARDMASRANPFEILQRRGWFNNQGQHSTLRNASVRTDRAFSGKRQNPTDDELAEGQLQRALDFQALKDILDGKK